MIWMTTAVVVECGQEREWVVGLFKESRNGEQNVDLRQGRRESTGPIPQAMMKGQNE